MGAATLALAFVAAPAGAAHGNASRDKVVAPITADNDGSIEPHREWVAPPTNGNKGVNTLRGGDGTGGGGAGK